MRDDREVERLREALSDERARRVHAERQLESERERTRVWRTRAEDRLQQLQRKRRPLFSLGRRRTAPSATAQKQRAPATGTEPGSATAPVPYHPTLRVAGWMPPEWMRSAADCVDLGEGDDELANADMVVVGGRDGHEALGEWMTWPGRQPLVLWDPDPSEAPVWQQHLAAGDLVVGPDPWSPARHLTPMVAADPRLHPPGAGEGESAVADSGTDRREIVIRALGRQPLLWRSGDLPGELAGLVVREGADRDRAGLVARLTAVRRHHPGTVLEQVAGAVGIGLPPSTPAVAILLVTRRPDRLPAALERIARLRHPRFRLMLGLHGWSAGTEVHDDLLRLGLSDVTSVMEFDEQLPLGKCLNEAAAATGADVLAKFDDDDLYGPWYLDEAVDELSTTGADLVGKATQFVHLVGPDQLLLHQPGRENTDIGYVNGPTFVMPHRSWEQVRFPHRRARVDSVFVRGLRAAGGTIRSSSRFEFVLGRYPDGHTWQASDERFLAASEVVGTGEDLSRVWLDAGL